MGWWSRVVGSGGDRLGGAGVSSPIFGMLIASALWSLCAMSVDVVVANL